MKYAVQEHASSLMCNNGKQYTALMKDKLDRKSNIIMHWTVLLANENAPEENNIFPASFKQQ